MSEESTEWALPSNRVIRTSTTGIAGEHALLQLGPRALLDRGDELARHGAADHLVDELDAAPRSSGSISSWQTAYCPCPPDCLTSRPCTCTCGHEGLPQRGPQRLDLHLDVVAVAQRSMISWSTWAGPIAHSTTWWVSALCSSRIVTSSATIRCSARAELVLVASWTWRGSPRAAAGSGRHPGLDERRLVLARQGVRGLCVRLSLRHQDDVAGDARTAWPAWRRPSGRRQRADALVVAVVVAVALQASRPTNWLRWPETWTGSSGRRVPEKTRTSDSRPT